MLLYFPGCLIINVNEILILSQASLQPNASLAAAHVNVERGRNERSVMLERNGVTYKTHLLFTYTWKLDHTYPSQCRATR